MPVHFEVRGGEKDGSSERERREEDGEHGPHLSVGQLPASRGCSCSVVRDPYDLFGTGCPPPGLPPDRSCRIRAISQIQLSST